MTVAFLSITDNQFATLRAWTGFRRIQMGKPDYRNFQGVHWMDSAAADKMVGSLTSLGRAYGVWFPLETHH